MTAILEPVTDDGMHQLVVRIRVGQQWTWARQDVAHNAVGMPRRVEIMEIDLPGYAVLVNRERRILHPNVFVDGTYALAHHSDHGLRTPYQLVYRTMPAFSAQQPWAWLIANGIMKVFNSPEAPPTQAIGQRVWLHAGEVNQEAFTRVADMGIEGYPKLVSQFPTDSVIGSVVITRHVDYWRSQWFVGPIGWLLEKPVALPHPIMCKKPEIEGQFWTPTMNR